MADKLIQDIGNAEDAGLVDGGPAATRPDSPHLQFAQADTRQVVSQPPAGQSLELRPAPGQEIVVDFNPDDAEISIEGNTFVLEFPDQSRILFLDLLRTVEDSGADAPRFLIGGESIPAAQLIAPALAALEDPDDTELPPLLLGSGNNVYTGPVLAPLNLLDDSPVIPETGLQFGLIEADAALQVIEATDSAPPVDDDDDPPPEVRIDAAVLSEQGNLIKEDVADAGLAYRIVATGEAEVAIDSLVITFPAGLTESHLNFATTRDSGGTVQVTGSGTENDPVVATVTFDADRSLFAGGFTLDAPVEDSDVDLNAVNFFATARNLDDPDATGTASLDLEITVDAVLDDAFSVTQGPDRTGHRGSGGRAGRRSGARPKPG